jgi:RPA family protein
MEKDIELLSQGKIFAEKEADRFRNLFNEAFSEKTKIVEELWQTKQLAEKEVERYKALCEDLKKVSCSQQSKYAYSSEIEELKRAKILAEDEVRRSRNSLNDLNVIFNFVRN